MKLESLKSSKFEAFESKKITALKEIIGGNWTYYNTSYHISGGSADGTDVASWSFSGSTGDMSGSYALDGISGSVVAHNGNPTLGNVGNVGMLNIGNTMATGSGVLVNPINNAQSSFNSPINSVYSMQTL